MNIKYFIIIKKRFGGCLLLFNRNIPPSSTCPFELYISFLMKNEKNHIYLSPLLEQLTFVAHTF